MSMSVSGPVSPHAAQSAAQRARDAAAARTQASDNNAADALAALKGGAAVARPTASRNEAAGVLAASTPGAAPPAAAENSPRQPTEAGQVVAERSAAVAERFAAIGASWSERFDRLETQARESGNDARADQLGEVGARVLSQLDQTAQKVASQLDGISQRLSQRYAVAGDEAADTSAPAVDEDV